MLHHPPYVVSRNIFRLYRSLSLCPEHICNTLSFFGQTLLSVIAVAVVVVVVVFHPMQCTVPNQMYRITIKSCPFVSMGSYTRIKKKRCAEFSIDGKHFCDSEKRNNGESNRWWLARDGKTRTYGRFLSYIIRVIFFCDDDRQRRRP